VDDNIPVPKGKPDLRKIHHDVESEPSKVNEIQVNKDEVKGPSEESQ